MWRKPNETKPSGQNQSSPSPVPSRPQVTQAVQSLPTASAVGTPETSAPQSVAPPPAPASVAPKPAISTAAAPVMITAPVAVSSSTSVISAGLKIRGEISGNSDLHIEGEAHGKIRLTGGRVSVGPKGSVQADVDAREIVVEGSLRGNLKASESVRLGSSSRVQGSVITPRIGIEDGARLSGKVEMVRANESRPASNVVAEPDSSRKAEPMLAITKVAESTASHA